MPGYKILATLLQTVGIVFIGGPIGWDLLGMGGHVPGVIDIRLGGWLVMGIGVALWFAGLVIVVLRTSDSKQFMTDDEELIEREEEGPIEESVEEKYLCPSCGLEVASNSSSCWSCGDRFETIEYECPSCESTVISTATTCSNCGERFGVEPPVPPPSATTPVAPSFTSRDRPSSSERSEQAEDIIWE